ncbi:hypothetical protein [Mycolicibacterium palauense]|uniref:hypothetical protein n=1 Tax=Mycolicibacterium palauense TaxID=2034511 RepID=UPI001145DDF1|nr:hypothetical protein [Mycolicibacterium palauense]
MLWVFVVVLVGAVFAVAFALLGATRLVMAPHRAGLTARQRIALVVLAVMAVAAAAWVVDQFGWGAAVAPVLVWLAAFALLRNTAPVRESEAEQFGRLEEEFGPDGAQQLVHARACVEAIRGTRAADDGWLGDRAELDFTGDLDMIAGHLQRARSLQRVIDESAALPHASADDLRLQHDAERAVARLRDEVTERIQALGDCAIQAQQLDGMLAAEQERDRLAARRDDVRSRLSSLLYGTEATPAAPPSPTAEAINARVAAFRELKDDLKLQRRQGDQSSRNDGSPGPDLPSAG